MGHNTHQQNSKTSQNIGKLNTVSSPRNPQSNGMAEHCVQTMKASLIKTIEEGEDVALALLTYKTTPLNHRLPSPAKLLNSRKYKTLLPIRIVPRLQESYRQIMDQGKQVQAQLYNKNTRLLLRLPTISESCSSTRSRQKYLDTSRDHPVPNQ